MDNKFNIVQEILDLSDQQDSIEASILLERLRVIFGTGPEALTILREEVSKGSVCWYDGRVHLSRTTLEERSAIERSVTLAREEVYENAVYALHLDGKILGPRTWRSYSTTWGNASLHGWRPPKKVYHKIGHAKSAIAHLPKELQGRVEIVKYTPEEEK